MNNKFAKPFIKWAGGKGQLIETFKKKFPKELIEGNIKHYVEPFVGGGAVLFYILQNYNVQRAYINDINKELINCYVCVKANVEKVINKLKKLEYTYKTAEDKENFYYDIRSQYNSNVLDNLENYDKCVEFLFLNKTCFNGLYRVNKQGEFNVPHGRYKNPAICDEENLRQCSKLLQKVEISFGPYQHTFNDLHKNTFIYLDPPYRPLPNSNSFSSYTQYKFDDTQQIELAQHFCSLAYKNIKVMLSNSDPKNTDKKDCFFDQLYKNFNIERINAKRMINCHANQRGFISEIIVRNYK